MKKYLYRRPTRLPASRCPALHPRRSRRSEHRERRECRRHRQPIPRRVGRGRVINYASNSMKYREARLYRTQGYHLKATCEAQRFCEKSAAPPKCRPRRRRRGWRHFRPRLTSYAYVHDGYYRALRRQLYGFKGCGGTRLVGFFHQGMGPVDFGRAQLLRRFDSRVVACGRFADRGVLNMSRVVGAPDW